MSEKVNNPKDVEPIAETTDDPLSEAVGIWKNRWPDEMDSVQIGRRFRKESGIEIVFNP